MEFDDRIRRYEKIARIQNDQGAAVKVDPGTRVYREIGGETALRLWMQDVQTAFDGELVPFEWVADYVGISRAALHKRVNRGGLTVLVFEMQELVKGVLGGTRERMRREYKYVPKRECDAWRDQLFDQAE